MWPRQPRSTKQDWIFWQIANRSTFQFNSLHQLICLLGQRLTSPLQAWHKWRWLISSSRKALYHWNKASHIHNQHPNSSPRQPKFHVMSTRTTTELPLNCQCTTIMIHPTFYTQTVGNCPCWQNAIHSCGREVICRAFIHRSRAIWWYDITIVAMTVYTLNMLITATWVAAYIHICRPRTSLYSTWYQYQLYMVGLY